MTDEELADALAESGRAAEALAVCLDALRGILDADRSAARHIARYALHAVAELAELED